MNFFSRFLADLSALAHLVVSSASTVENLFPHAAGGIENAAQAAAKAGVATELVKAAIPALATTVPDAAVAKVVEAVPAVMAAVTAAKAAYDANPANVK
jgi:type VI protein secretion system component VasF